MSLAAGSSELVHDGESVSLVRWENYLQRTLVVCVVQSDSKLLRISYQGLRGAYLATLLVTALLVFSHLCYVYEKAKY